MLNTVRERIVQHIVTTIQGITTAAGYGNTIQSVQRFQQRGQQFFNVPLVIVRMGSEDAEDGPYPLISYRLEVSLMVVARQGATDPRGSDELINDLVGDIRKAMSIDRTRGALAVDTSALSSDPWPAEEGQPDIGVVMSTTIEYRTNALDPTVSA